jgi:hypothetical protein
VANRKHKRARRRRRYRVPRAGIATQRRWLVLLVAHTLATIILMIIGAILHVAPPSLP